VAYLTGAAKHVYVNFLTTLFYSFLLFLQQQHHSPASPTRTRGAVRCVLGAPFLLSWAPGGHGAPLPTPGSATGTQSFKNQLGMSSGPCRRFMRVNPRQCIVNFFRMNRKFRRYTSVDSYRHSLGKGDKSQDTCDL
jgi:hypothetical protein